LCIIYYQFILSIPKNIYKQGMDIKNSTLIVGLDEENPGTISKLKNKPKELESYKATIEGKNQS